MQQFPFWKVDGGEVAYDESTWIHKNENTWLFFKKAYMWSLSGRLVSTVNE